jgi:hypothetical protein
MIPSTIHMIYPMTDKTRPWSIVNDLAVKLAQKHHDPNHISITTNKPMDLPKWVRESVGIVEIELPTHFEGVEIVYPQYIADIMRLQILRDYGGIYMDTDILLQKPLAEFLSEVRLVMSWETQNRRSISNALMMSSPGNSLMMPPPGYVFIEEWLDRMPKAIQSNTWAYGGVVLPALMAENPYLKDYCVVLDHTFCCPLDLSRDWLFNPALKAEAKNKIKDAHAIHVFETYWRDIIKNITLEWIENNDCLFSELYREAMA